MKLAELDRCAQINVRLVVGRGYKRIMYCSISPHRNGINVNFRQKKLSALKSKFPMVSREQTHHAMHRISSAM